MQFDKIAFRKSLQTIRANNKAFNLTVQSAAKQAFVWLISDGNANGFYDILAAMGGSADGTRFSQWVELNFPVVKKENSYKVNKKVLAELQAMSDVEQLAHFSNAGDWYAFKPNNAAKIPSVWDGGEYMLAVISKLNKEGDAAFAAMLEKVVGTAIADGVLRTSKVDVEIID